jgi:hypothetical protein
MSDSIREKFRQCKIVKVPQNISVHQEMKLGIKCNKLKQF